MSCCNYLCKEMYIGRCDYIDYVEPKYKNKILISRCCHNKMHVYKVFDETKLNDINFIEEIYKVLKEKPEPLLQQKCSMINDYCKLPEIEKFSCLQVALYSACNAKCEFCCSKDDTHNTALLNKELYLKTLYNAKGKVKELKLTDEGEPLILQKEMKEFFKSLKPGDFECILFNTNGILLDEELVQIMKDAPCWFNINISLNAPNRELYKKIVGVDAFDKVIESINLLKNTGYLRSISLVYYEPLFGKIDNIKEELSKYIGEDFFEHNKICLYQKDANYSKKYNTQEFQRFQQQPFSARL